MLLNILQYKEQPPTTENVCVCAHALSLVSLFPTPWTVARQAPLSMEFPMQKYWSRLPFPPPGDLPNPGIESTSLGFPALAGRSFNNSTTWKAHNRE